MLKATKFMSVLLIVILGCVGITACAPAAESEAKVGAALKAVSCELEGVYAGYGGAEVVIVNPVFKISNPSNLEIIVSGIDYEIDAGGGLYARKKIERSFYIPAGERTTVDDNCWFLWADLLTDTIMKGMAPGAASVACISPWKAIGGKLPMAALKDAWQAAETKTVVYKVRGTITLSADGIYETLVFHN